MVSSILRPLLRSVEGRAVPTLFLLDEFAQLGHMEMIEDNYALMRGYGVKLWTIFQDLNQAKIRNCPGWLDRSRKPQRFHQGRWVAGQGADDIPALLLGGRDKRANGGEVRRAFG
jgi:hypothetical protein